MLRVEAWLQVVRREIPRERTCATIILGLLLYLPRTGRTSVVRVMRLLLGHGKGKRLGLFWMLV